MSRATRESLPVPPQMSSSVSRYQLLDPLGEGGMAIIYRARERNRGSEVAVKRLKVPTDVERAQRSRALFEREFHTLSQLAHPRVVQVFDYGVDDEGPYYTMELLDGADLQHQKGADWRTACAWMRDICSVLSLVHSRQLVHRDISPRNIRCTSGGQAKLLDFGALVPMGPSKHVVGTPVICAPEVVNMERLDGRCDLYSLGCTLYFTLVGHHAYPASDFGQLPLLWGSRPVRPSSEVSGIPEELDALVMSLIDPDPAARPSSAAEVMERLTAIADLPADEQLNVSYSYLTSPTLVGRRRALSVVEERLARARTGTGGAVLLLGDSGMGRSRVLEASLLRSKIAGALVLHADANDCGGGELGVVDVLVRQLLRVHPSGAWQSAQPDLAVLGQAFPLLLAGRPISAPPPVNDRRAQRARLQHALQGWLTRFARVHSLVVGVDDFDRMDEFSQAFVSLLANAAPSANLLVVATATAEAVRDPRGAMTLLADSSRRVALKALTPGQVDALLRSVFGDVHHAASFAHQLHALCDGNPRDVMAFARHLVETGVISYEAGAWSLPSRIEDTDLPQSLDEAFRAKVRGLDAETVQLARAFALSPGLQAGLDEMGPLCMEATAGRVLRSVDQLLANGILRGAGERFELSQRGWSTALLAELSPAEAAPLHLRLAAFFSERGNEFLAARHMLTGGQEEAGLDRLIRYARDSQHLTDTDPLAYVDVLNALPTDWLGTFDLAYDLCEKLGRSRQDLYALYGRASGLATGTAGGWRAVLGMVNLLAEASGLDLAQQADPDLEPQQRISKVFEAAHARYARTPERDRVCEPLQALRPLSRAYVQAIGSVAALQSVELWETLPSLEPFAGLSPGLGLVSSLCKGVGARASGHPQQAMRLYEAVFERLSRPDRAGLDASHATHSLAGLASAMGQLLAPTGSSQTLRWVERTEAEPLYRVAGIFNRMLYHLWQGDTIAAQASRRDAELMRMRQPSIKRLDAGHLMGELLAYAETDDLVQLKQALPAVRQSASAQRNWVPVVQFARGEYERIRGAHAAAVRDLEAASQLVEAGRHPMYCEIVGAHVRALSAMGAVEKACLLGERYLQAAREAQLGHVVSFIAMPLAVTLAGRGDVERAIELSEEVLRDLEAIDAGGVLRGRGHETRALVAVAAQDQAGFDEQLGYCVEYYGRHANRGLLSRIHRLRETAHRAGLVVLGRRRGDSLPTRVHELNLSTMLSSCQVASARAERALELMIERAGAVGGALYAVEREGPSLMACLNLGKPESDVAALVRGALVYEAEYEQEDTQTTGVASQAPVTLIDQTLQINTPRDMHVYHSLLIAHSDRGEFRTTGFAIFRVPVGKTFNAPSDLATQLSRYWFDLGDATCLGTDTGWAHSRSTNF